MPPVSWLEDSRRLLADLYPRTRFTEVGRVALDQGAFPRRDAINIGVFRNGVVIATRRAMLFNPTKLEPRS